MDLSEILLFFPLGGIEEKMDFQWISNGCPNGIPAFFFNAFGTNFKTTQRCELGLCVGMEFQLIYSVHSGIGGPLDIRNWPGGRLANAAIVYNCEILNG